MWYSVREEGELKEMIENGKVVIHAVHERDAEKFWRKLELKVVEKCFICGAEVTCDSFSAISPWNGEIVVICESLSCFYEFNIKKRNRMIKKGEN